MTTLSTLQDHLNHVLVHNHVFYDKTFCVPSMRRKGLPTSLIPPKTANDDTPFGLFIMKSEDLHGSCDAWLNKVQIEILFS